MIRLFKVPLFYSIKCKLSRNGIFAVVVGELGAMHLSPSQYNERILNKIAKYINETYTG